MAAAREPEASDFGGSSGLADRLFVGSRKASALSSVVERWRRSFLKTATLFSFLMASLCILQHITPMCIIPASHARAVAATVQEADGMAQKVKFAKACLSFGLGIFVGSLVMKGKSFMRKDEGTRTSGSGDKDKDSEAVAIDITALQEPPSSSGTKEHPVDQPTGSAREEPTNSPSSPAAESPGDAPPAGRDRKQLAQIARAEEYRKQKNMLAREQQMQAQQRRLEDISKRADSAAKLALDAAEVALDAAAKADAESFEANRYLFEQKAIEETRKQPKTPEEEAALQAKYGQMDLEEKAFNILVDLGMIDLHDEPTDLSEDDEQSFQ